MSQDDNLIVTDSELEKHGIKLGRVPAVKLQKKYDMILRLAKSGAHAFTVMDKFYEVADEMLAAAYPQNKCERGCSHCCYVAAGICGLEAKHIEDRTGAAITNWQSEKPNTKTWEPCVFLDGDECSIYEHRPMVCRAFQTFDDPKLCEKDNLGKSHMVLALLPPGEGGFEWLNELYMEVMTAYLRGTPELQIFADIRTFFKGHSTKGELC